MLFTHFLDMNEVLFMQIPEGHYQFGNLAIAVVNYYILGEYTTCENVVLTLVL